jgi:hypothetical protein
MTGSPRSPGAAVQAGVEQGGGQESAQQPLGLVVVERLLRRLVLDQLDAEEVTVAADVSDDQQIEELLQRGAEERGVLADVLQEPLLLEDVEILRGDRGRHGVPAERVPVGEGGRAVSERLVDTVAYDRPAQGRVPAGDGLRERDHVGLVVVGLGAEVRPEAAEGADDLVGDEQHVVFVADLAHALEVARRRREAAAGILHRLEEDRRDRVRALEEDHLLDPVRRPESELLRRPAREAHLRSPVVVGVRHPEPTGRHRLEHRLHARHRC